MASLQEDQTLLKTSLHSPALVRSMLTLLLAIETPREDGRETPELGFLRNRLKTVDKRQRTEDVLDVPTIVSLLTCKNRSGDTVLQDKAVDQDNLKMMLALALSVLGEETKDKKRQEFAAKILPELVNYRPQDKESIDRLSNYFEALKEIISEEKNEEVKELVENLSLPSAVREALGLKAIGLYDKFCQWVPFGKKKPLSFNIGTK